MPCLVIGVGAFFPRIAIVLTVLFSEALGRAYDTWIWPLLGFFFLPYTTLAYAWAWHAGGGGVRGFWLALVVVAVLVDLAHLGGGGRTWVVRAHPKRRRPRRGVHSRGH